MTTGGDTAGGGRIFDSLVLSRAPARRPLGGVPVSLVLHGALASVLLLVSIGPVRLPAVRAFQPILLGLPGGAPPPLGRPNVRTSAPRKAETRATTPTVREDALVVTAEPASLVEPPTSEEAAPSSASSALGPPGSPDGVEGGPSWGLGSGAGPGGPGDCSTCTGLERAPDQRARLLVQVKPVYPHDAFVKRVQGRVVIDAVVDTTGHVLRPHVVLSIPMLDEAALECVQKWLFAPARFGGSAIASSARLEVTFQIF